MTGEILAVIPARGGSRGIPRKNLRPLGGVPLIVHTIRQAQASRRITRMVVSTEDEEIAAVAREHGAEVPFARPPELAGDAVPDLPVFQHCLRMLREREGYVPQVIVHLRATAPLRDQADIDGAVDLLLDSPGADSVRSVSVAGQHPLKMWRLDEDGVLVPFVPPESHAIAEAYNRPRQELPVAYLQNGAVDVFWERTISEIGSMTGRRILGWLMPEERSVNIDSWTDWYLAERMLEVKLSGTDPVSAEPGMGRT